MINNFDGKFEKYMKRAVLYCQENDMEVNEHGVYIYTSQNGHSSINLPCILQHYADECLDGIIKKEIEIIKETEEQVGIDFNIRTLDDKMKYDFLVENFDKLKLIDLETLIN